MFRNDEGKTRWLQSLTICNKSLSTSGLHTKYIHSVIVKDNSSSGIKEIEVGGASDTFNRRQIMNVIQIIRSSVIIS